MMQMRKSSKPQPGAVFWRIRRGEHQSQMVIKTRLSELTKITANSIPQKGRQVIPNASRIPTSLLRPGYRALVKYGYMANPLQVIRT